MVDTNSGWRASSGFWCSQNQSWFYRGKACISIYSVLLRKRDDRIKDSWAISLVEKVSLVWGMREFQTNLAQYHATPDSSTPFGVYILLWLWSGFPWRAAYRKRICWSGRSNNPHSYDSDIQKHINKSPSCIPWVDEKLSRRDKPTFRRLLSPISELPVMKFSPPTAPVIQGTE